MNNDFISYLMACFVSLFSIVFLFRIPQLLTNNSKLVHEYYFKNFSINIPIDVILIFIYLQISLSLIDFLKIKTEIYKIIIISIVTIIISGGFYIYFISYKKTDSFFSRWFHSVGHIAIIYDIILLLFTYFIFRYLQFVI